MSGGYVQHGAEWERELMQWRKKDIIALLRSVLTKRKLPDKMPEADSVKIADKGGDT